MARSGWDLQRPILGPDGRQIAPEFLRYLQGIGATGASAAAPGQEGPQGARGETGPGLATGGTSGEVLAKSSGADFDTGWIPLADIARSGSASDLAAGTVAAARMPALSGDVATAAGGVATTLKTVNANVGSYGDASHSASLTVNAKGLVTAAGSQAIAIGVSAVSGLAAIATSGSAADLAAGTIPAARMPALTGDVTTAAGGVATTLQTVNGTIGSFGDASHSASLTVNAKGLVTAAGSQAISIGASAVSGLAAVATSGSAADLGSGVLPDARLSNVITAGSAGDASHTTALAWDSHGRVTVATPTAIAIAAGAVSGLGTAATRDTGVSGAAVPLLNAANTWSATQTYAVAPAFSDAAGTRTALGLGTLATQSGSFSGTSSGTNTGDQTFSLTVPPIFTAGAASTSALSFSIASQAANLVWTGPSSGAAAPPAFRALAPADIPSLDAGKINSGMLAAAQMPALTGDVTTTAGGVGTVLATVNASAGTFGDSSHVAQVTVNGKGLTTSIASVAITASGIGALSATNNLADLFNLPSARQNLATQVAAYAFAGTDGNATLSVSTRPGTYIHGVTLTADRTYTLSSVGAYLGLRWRLVRKGGGAFSWIIRDQAGGLTIKSLASNNWMDVEFDGTSWQEVAFGSL